MRETRNSPDESDFKVVSNRVGFRVLDYIDRIGPSVAVVPEWRRRGLLNSVPRRIGVGEYRVEAARCIWEDESIRGLVVPELGESD